MYGWAFWDLRVRQENFCGCRGAGLASAVNVKLCFNVSAMALPVSLLIGHLTEISTDWKVVFCTNAFVMVRPYLVAWLYVARILCYTTVAGYI